MKVPTSFRPTVGDSYNILSYASETGTFGTITGLSLPGGITLVPAYNAQNFTLTVANSPDVQLVVVAPPGSQNGIPRTLRRSPLQPLFRPPPPRIRAKLPRTAANRCRDEITLGTDAYSTRCAGTHRRPAFRRGGRFTLILTLPPRDSHQWRRRDGTLFVGLPQNRSSTHVSGTGIGSSFRPKR